MSRAHPTATATTIDSIKHSLVGLRMPRALEVLAPRSGASSRVRSTGSAPSTRSWSRNSRCERAAA